MQYLTKQHHRSFEWWETINHLSVNECSDDNIVQSPFEEICACLTLARTCIANGKYMEAKEVMDDLSEEVEACNSHILSSTFDFSAG